MHGPIEPAERAAPDAPASEPNADILVAVVLLVIGLAIFFGDVKQVLDRSSAADWPARPAVVRRVERGLVWCEACAADVHRVVPFYRWLVGEQAYEGAQWRAASGPPGRDFRSREAADEWAAAFPAGREIEVHVDPLEPARAVALPRGGRAGPGIFIGALMALIGAVVIGLALVPDREGKRVSSLARLRRVFA